jgi:hypothetical protein
MKYGDTGELHGRNKTRNKTSHCSVRVRMCVRMYIRVLIIVFVTYETSPLLYNKNKIRTHLMLRPMFMGMQEGLREDLGNR